LSITDTFFSFVKRYCEWTQSFSRKS